MSAPRARRWGAIEKMVRFAEAREARLGAAPPIGRKPAGSEVGAPLEFTELLEPSVVLRCLRTPFEEEGAPSLGSPRGAEAWEQASLRLATTEGLHFGGSFAWLRSLAKDPAVPLLAWDCFVGVTQLAEARACGARGIAPLLNAAARADFAWDTLLSAAQDQALLLAPEVTNAEELAWVEQAAQQRPEAFVRVAGRPLVLLSARSRETFRAELPAELEPVLASAQIACVRLFADAGDTGERNVVTFVDKAAESP